MNSNRRFPPHLTEGQKVPEFFGPFRLVFGRHVRPNAETPKRMVVWAADVHN